MIDLQALSEAIANEPRQGQLVGWWSPLATYNAGQQCKIVAVQNNVLKIRYFNVTGSNITNRPPVAGRNTDTYIMNAPVFNMSPSDVFDSAYAEYTPPVEPDIDGGGSGGGGGGGGVAPDLSNYVMKNSAQPQTIESDLVIGNTKNISILNETQNPEHAVPKRYVDGFGNQVNALQQHYTDLEGRVAVNESDLIDVRPLLDTAPELVYTCSDMPNKNMLVLNLTPEVFKRGVPKNSFALDLHSCLPTMPEMINLQYDNNQNQQSFGVTTGFNDQARGYDRSLGFWYIGRDPRINFINIANLNLTQATGLTIELEFEITNSPRDNFTSLFSIVTNSNISTNPAQDQYRSTNNFNIVYGDNNYWCKDKRDSDLISNGLGITGGVNQRNKMLFTIQGTALKAYKDYQHRGNGTLENYAQETYKYILLNRGAYFGRNRIFANMKIWKLRLWRGVLTPEQITALANM